MTAHSTQQAILDCYESIRRLSRTMVDAAQRADWESLAACERICGLLIERLQAYGDPERRLGPEERRRRHAILRDVLADDAAIRRFTEPSLARLDAAFLAPSRGAPRGG